MALFTVGIVYGVTLTADATESVTIPVAALGEVCLADSDTGACTSTTGEILFGNAVVVNRVAGDSIGLVLIQFGGQLYRAVNVAPVYEYNVRLSDGKTVTATSRELRKLEDQIEDLEVIRLLGLQGTLSQVLSNGNEVYTTGEVRVIEDVKGPGEEPVPVGEYYIEYEGLVLEDSNECGPYNYLDESGEPVKGISTRECVSQRGVMTAGEYTHLELTINAPGGISSVYKLTEITGTTSFEWNPE